MSARTDGDPEDRGQGAALGLGGIPGFFAWRNRSAGRAAIDDVTPGTWRGALTVAAWFAGWIAISIVVSQVLPTAAAVVLGLVVMVIVGRWWGNVRRRPESRSRRADRASRAERRR